MTGLVAGGWILLALSEPAQSANAFDGRWVGSAKSTQCDTGIRGENVGWDFDGPIELNVEDSHFTAKLDALGLSGTVGSDGNANGSGDTGTAVFKVTGNFSESNARLVASYQRHPTACDVFITLTRDGNPNAAADTGSPIEESKQSTDRNPDQRDNTGQAPSSCSTSTVKDRLRAVNDLLEQKLISVEEADAKRSEILTCL